MCYIYICIKPHYINTIIGDTNKCIKIGVSFLDTPIIYLPLRNLN